MTQSKPTARPAQIRCAYRNCRIWFTPNPKRQHHRFHSPNCRLREWQARHYCDPKEIERMKIRIRELESGRNKNQ